MVESVKVKITTVQEETTVAVNKSCTFRIRTMIVVGTENLCSVLHNFFHTTIADSAIIAVSSGKTRELFLWLQVSYGRGTKTMA